MPRTRPPIEHGDDVLRPLRDLPEIIASLEAAGTPVVVERAPGSLRPHEERLFATLGVLVRFVEPAQDREAQDRPGA